MPHGPDVVLRTRDLTLRFGPDGAVTSVAPVARPDLPWLSAVGPLRVVDAEGRARGLGPADVAVDVDEVQVERSAGGLRTTVRHGAEETWDLRVTLANESDDDLVLDEVRLDLRAGAGCVPVALAAGSVAAYAVQRISGDGPLLVGRLRSGAQTGTDEDGFSLGPVTLARGHRWSASWRFEVEPDARRGAAGALPDTPWLSRGQAVQLPAGPDVAVVATGLDVEVRGDLVEVTAPGPGSWPVELRGARGTSRFDLSWAPDLDDLVDTAAARLLRGPATPGGTVRLPDAAAGLLLQDAAERRSVDAPEDVTDALDLLLGSLLDPSGGPDPGVPFVLVLLAREAARPGVETLLEDAVRALPAVRRPSPGLGLGGVALAVSLLRVGRSTDEVTGHLAAVRTSTTTPDDPAGRVDLAGLELALLLRPRARPADDAVLADLRRLGAELGAGLPGHVLPAPALDRLAYAATLLALVDDVAGHRLRGRWGLTAAELADRSAAQVRARLAREPDGPAGRAALAWLVLGRPPR